MIRALKIYLQGIKISLSARMAYRGDFFISIFIMLIGELVAPLTMFLIYRNGATFPGWNLYEVLLIQAIFLISKGIASPLFFGIIFNTLSKVRDGSFDILLLKPHSALFMTMVTAFDSEDIGKLIGGIAIFTIAITNLQMPGIFQWLQFFLLMLLSIITLFSFTLIMAGTVFKWVGNGRVFEIYDSVTNFGLYPTSIFSKTVQLIITSIIPVAIIGFLPAATLLGKPSSGIFAAVVSSFIFLLFSLWFWNFMLEKYTSAGG